MTKVAILRSSFLEQWEGKGQENLTHVLNHDHRYFVEKACREKQWEIADSIHDLQEGDICFNISAVGLNEEHAYQFLASEQTTLRDAYGNLCGVKILGPDHSWLSEMEETISFEDFTEQYFTIYQEADEDRFDEVFLEAPVVDSFRNLEIAEKLLAGALCDQWMKKGVRIDDSTSVFIDPEVEIGPGTHIEPNVRLLGKTRIGAGCRITAGSEIVDSILEEHVIVKHSLIEESYMEEGANIGPYSHLRPKAHLGKHVHIGNFVEVKNAVLEDDTKAGHLAYIGDADVGKDVNISCGVIFCNYDGKRKHRSHVGDHAFLGSNANLIAPVEVEEDGFIAAGSTITKKVEKGALALERAEQKNIAGYVEKRKEKGTL
ncbi:MAG: hypothetical protein SOW48_04590 [Peptoniphilaceae bacterium]|nr:hypothetical protein [Peptoniphilaceae bacterium]MDD7433980.1 hypothetical protein [Peptoniphilaceae bacterium]MDY3075906.1 hypothetical protein [Peptoniphilaceae bacterium]MDY4196394.1 hypothetical protein [Peptoniphilaceae bacterium]